MNGGLSVMIMETINVVKLYILLIHGIYVDKIKYWL